MSLKDSVFSVMKPTAEETLPAEIAQMAITLFDEIKRDLLFEAKSMTRQNSFQYDAFVITDDKRMWEKHDLRADKKGCVSQYQATEYANRIRQALVDFAQEDGITIGNYMVLTSTGNVDYYYGRGTWENPRLLLARKSKLMVGHYYALPFTREVTFERAFKPRKDVITNSEGVFDRGVYLDTIYVGLPVSFHAER